MSWQNTVLCWWLKKRMKDLGRGTIDVQMVRTKSENTLFKARIPTGWRLRAVTVPTVPVAGEWLDPATPALERTFKRTVLYLHGGGYFFCSPKTHRSVTGGLARAAMARVFVPDYRLAPEHPAPAALEDALAAYRYLLSEGTAAKQIVIAGDSAGGGLTLALLLALRESGDPMPAAAVLFSPWTDLAVTGASVTSLAQKDVLFDGTGLREAAKLYLGTLPADDWRVSPLYGDLTGLPPLLVQASDSEVLLDDARRLAQRAKEAGVDVTFREWQNVPHAWQVFTPFLPEARLALRQAADFIRKHVDRPT